MNNVLILGDPHLGASLRLGKIGIGANINSRIIDQINLLDWTLDQAIEDHVDNIIITGDIFEEPKPHYSLIAFFITWLKKCQAYDVNVHVIIGNHDFLRSGNIYTSPLDIINEIDLDNVYVYKDINTILIGTTAFTLIPFKDRKSFGVDSNADAISLLQNHIVYELASIPSTYNKIVIGHLAIEGSIPVGDEIDDITNELFCPLSMFNGYDYVWMGHVHKPQVMQKKNPYIAHIGSMDVSNFGETDHKKIIVMINCDTNAWHHQNIPTRSLKKINISVPKDTEDSTGYILNELKKMKNFDKSIIKVEVTLDSPELKSINKSAIEKYLLSKGTFNVAGISESKKVSLIKRDNNNIIDTKMDVLSAIKTYTQTYIDESMRSNFIELAMEIYKSYKIEAKE